MFSLAWLLWIVTGRITSMYWHVKRLHLSATCCRWSEWKTLLLTSAVIWLMPSGAFFDELHLPFQVQCRLLGNFTYWISLSLSLKTNLTPEFWSQSEVWISWEKTGAKMAAENTCICRFAFDLQDIYFIFAVLPFTKHCAKTHTV